jgi:uncharacterized protein (TIGR02246 family)
LRNNGSGLIPAFQNETLKPGGTKMKRHTILLLSLLLVLCLSAAPSAMAASAEDEVLQVLQNFDKAVNTADLELMASLYWQSPKYSGFGPPKRLAYLSQGWEKDREMWRKMFEYPKGTYQSSSHNTQVLMLGDNAAVIAGYSTITFFPPAVKEETSELLRFTTVVQKIGGKWVIVHGHTSLLPTQ